MAVTCRVFTEEREGPLADLYSVKMDNQSKKAKRKNKKKYFQSSKKPKSNVLGPGMKGFLITCNREPECVKEAYHLLNEFADELYGPEIEEVKINHFQALDIEEQLLKEIQDMKSKKRRFQQVHTMVKGILFISTTVADPEHLVHAIFEKVLQSGKKNTRFILKMKPVVITCRPYESDIRKVLDVFLCEYSKKEKNRDLSYKVEAKIRNNTSISSSHINWYVRESVEKCAPKWIQSLEPDTVISVYVLQTVCCISLLKNYSAFKKYNLSELIPIENKNSNQQEESKVATGYLEENKSDAFATNAKYAVENSSDHLSSKE